MVRFRAGTNVFLAPVESVLEVRRVSDVKPLPGGKGGVAGLIEHNGRTLTVLSTFGAGGTQVVVLNAGANVFGLIADEVSGVVKVSELDIEPAPLGQERSLVSGVIKARTGLELMLSVDTLWRELQRSG